VPANGLVAGELDQRMFEKRQIESSNILKSRPDTSLVIGGGSGARVETPGGTSQAAVMGVRNGASVESFGTDRRQTKIFG
jgi:hypothetical protein